MKLIIAGSRDYDNYPEFEKRLNVILRNIDKKEILIISGNARGPDKMGERYANENGIECLVMKADWDKYGKNAGYRRNKDMAKIASHAVIFWDGVSKGTKHMIDLTTEYQIKTKVIKVRLHGERNHASD